MTKLEHLEILTGRIRAIWDANEEPHRALGHWGRWSMDRRGTRPVSTTRPWFWNEIDEDDRAGWGDEDAAPATPEATRKAEYDEKLALILDERIHAPGGLSVFQRRLLRVVYVSREVPEYQFPQACGCGWDLFCEQLDACLKFVGRFV